MDIQAGGPNKIFHIEPDESLDRITEAQFRADADRVLRLARSGHQVAIVDENGKITSVLGMNGVRFLPDPPPDPLENVDSECESPKMNQSSPWAS